MSLEFEDFESVRDWMDSLPGRDGTATTKYEWKLRLRRFCEWLGKTPDELISERREDMKSEDPKVRHRAEMYVKRFLKVLDDEGLSPNTRRTYYGAIRSFYKRNYQELTFFRGDGPGNESVTEGSRAASKEDIQRMVELSNPRDRALIMFIKDTGFGESDVAKLKLKNLGVEDISEVFTVEPPVTIITKRRKTGVETVTFMGREALDTLRSTLRIRVQGSPELKIRRYGRHEVRGGIPPEELTLESPVFRSYGKFLKTLKKPKIGHLNPHAISVIVRKAAIRAGVWKEGFSAHALRRFFQTSLESSGMNRNWIMRMMGHKLRGVEESYSKPEIEMLKEAYQRNYAYLAITETAEQRSRVEALENQVERLLLNSKRKDEEIQELQKKPTVVFTEDQARNMERLEQLFRELEKGPRDKPLIQWQLEMMEAMMRLTKEIILRGPSEKSEKS